MLRVMAYTAQKSRFSVMRVVSTEGRKLAAVPVFCIPKIGLWRKGISKKGDVVFHSEGRIICLADLHSRQVPGPEDKHCNIMRLENAPLFVCHTIT